MNQTAVVPDLEEAAPDDPLFTLASNSVDDQRNWALDETTKRYVEEHVISMLETIRSDMTALHEEWAAIARMTTMTHDEGQRYRGRSNVYVPSYAKARATLITSISQGMFPSDDYVSVTDKERPNDAEPVNALAVKTWLKYQFEKVAKVRKNMKPFIGQLIDYGIAIGKTWYDKTPAKSGKRAKVRMPNGGSKYRSTNHHEGLRFSTRSVFDWYVYPYNINGIEEATLVFEDLPVSRAFLRARERADLWENVDKALGAPEISEHTRTQNETTAEHMGTVQSSREFSGSDVGEQLTITEVWCDLVLPRAAYMEDEEPGVPIPCKLVLAGDVILQCVRNPFWHQLPPYVVVRDDPKPGNFFSKGKGHLIQGLQYLVNDFANQMNDNGIMGMNPMIIANPSTLAGPLTPLKPGGVWMTTDVQNGIRFDRPPIEQTQYGMQLIQLWASMVADFSGATPTLQGSKGAKTATSTQILQKNAMNPLKDLVEDIEESVMTPLMFMAWVLGQQYEDEKMMVEVMGDTGGWSPKSMTRDQLCGDFIFQWMASAQAANQAQRAEQGMRLLAALTPPLVQMLAQAGHTIDPYIVLKRVYQDSLGYRDFDKFVKANQMPPGMAGLPGQEGAGPEALPPGGPRSAVEQAAGAGPEASTMAPGEGDELDPIRQAIEAQTAMQGEEQ